MGRSPRYVSQDSCRLDGRHAAWFDPLLNCSGDYVMSFSIGNGGFLSEKVRAVGGILQLIPSTTIWMGYLVVALKVT